NQSSPALRYVPLTVSLKLISLPTGLSVQTNVGQGYSDCGIVGKLIVMRHTHRRFIIGKENATRRFLHLYLLSIWILLLSGIGDAARRLLACS
ncbi:MAG: hypothetical protein VW472_05860, partial [Candidatus Puniceispirillum sp.]